MCRKPLDLEFQRVGGGGEGEFLENGLLSGDGIDGHRLVWGEMDGFQHGVQRDGHSVILSHEVQPKQERTVLFAHETVEIQIDLPGAAGVRPGGQLLDAHAVGGDLGGIRGAGGGEGPANGVGAGDAQVLQL